MSKTYNVLVFFMSDLHRNKGGEVTKYYYYANQTDFDLGEPEGESVQTNETAIRVLQERLNAKGEKLDKVLAFATRLARQEKNAVEHLKEVLPELASIMELVDIDEELPFKSNLVPLGEMKKKIEAYVTACKKAEPGCKVQIHLDITGGFRHASMLMSALIKLLAFSELETQNVLYTKFVNQNEAKYFLVEDAHEVLDMYKLISGVDEFAHYGSVRILKDYFKGLTVSDNLTELLSAMESFSDRLKICNCQEEMTLSIIKLQQALESYQWQEPQEEIESFFSKLLPEINKEYQILFEGISDIENEPRLNVFALIHWAAERDMLQQALVYYTEWVPEFLAENQWLTAHADLIADLNNLNKAGTEWYDYLFTAYNRWNKELKLSKVTSSSLAFLCASRKYEKWLNIKLFNNYIQRISLEKCLKPGTASGDTLNCLSKFIAFVKQLEVSCGFLPDKNTFVTEARALYDKDKIASEPCGFAEAVEVARLHFDYNGALSVNLFLEKYFSKFPYAPSGSSKLFCYDLFAEYLLGALNFEKTDSINGKCQVSKLSKVLRLPDYLEQELPDKGKGIAREDIFAALLKYRFKDGRKALTALKVSDQELCAIAAYYGQCKHEYRNFSSHANFSYTKPIEELKQEILSVVAPFINIK